MMDLVRRVSSISCCSSHAAKKAECCQIIRGRSLAMFHLIYWVGNIFFQPVTVVVEGFVSFGRPKLERVDIFIPGLLVRPQDVADWVVPIGVIPASSCFPAASQQIHETCEVLHDRGQCFLVGHIGQAPGDFHQLGPSHFLGHINLQFEATKFVKL